MPYGDRAHTTDTYATMIDNAWKAYCAERRDAHASYMTALDAAAAQYDMARNHAEAAREAVLEASKLSAIHRYSPIDKAPPSVKVLRPDGKYRALYDRRRSYHNGKTALHCVVVWAKKRQIRIRVVVDKINGVYHAEPMTWDPNAHMIEG